MQKQENLIKYYGNCHCQAIKFEVYAPKNIVVIKCNCSICIMKQNHHFIVPKCNFQLIQGEDNLSCYQFNTQQAKHYFCKTCGIHSYYQPRSNPDGIALTIYCIQNSQDADSIDYQEFDGQNWEKCYQTSDIRKFSQTQDK